MYGEADKVMNGLSRVAFDKPHESSTIQKVTMNESLNMYLDYLLYMPYYCLFYFPLHLTVRFWQVEGGHQPDLNYNQNNAHVMIHRFISTSSNHFILLLTVFSNGITK